MEEERYGTKDCFSTQVYLERKNGGSRAGISDRRFLHRTRNGYEFHPRRSNLRLPTLLVRHLLGHCGHRGTGHVGAARHHHPGGTRGELKERLCRSPVAQEPALRPRGSCNRNRRLRLHGRRPDRNGARHQRLDRCLDQNHRTCLGFLHSAHPQFRGGCG